MWLSRGGVISWDTNGHTALGVGELTALWVVESMGSDVSDGETPSHERLQDIFLEVTGTDVCLETQEQHAETGRDVAPKEDSTAEYVSTMVQDDGLDGTLAEPASEGQRE